MIYIGRQQWSVGPQPKKKQKPAAVRKYEAQLAQLENVRAKKKKLESELKQANRPVEEWQKVRDRQNEALRRAQKARLPEKEQIKAMHSVPKGSVRYEDFIAARNKTDKIRHNIHLTSIEEATVEHKAEKLKPADIEPKGSWGETIMGAIIFLFFILGFLKMMGL